MLVSNLVKVLSANENQKESLQIMGKRLLQMVCKSDFSLMSADFSLMSAHFTAYVYEFWILNLAGIQIADSFT